jgi:hypothetical protein
MTSRCAFTGRPACVSRAARLQPMTNATKVTQALHHSIAPVFLDAHVVGCQDHAVCLYPNLQANASASRV